MIYRPSEDRLERQGLIKKCPIDRKAIESLLGRAEIDLKTARRNLEDDPECAHTFAYRASQVLRALPKVINHAIAEENTIGDSTCRSRA